MTSFLNREVQNQLFPPKQTIWHGEIAKDVADIADLVSVVLPDYHPDYVWGPCRWQARDAISLPAKGDACIVMFNNRNEPWIVAWWPF